MERIWMKIPYFLRNKYSITLLIVFVWILVFDRNNLIDRIKIMHELNLLENVKQYYLERIGEDSRKLNELKTDRENLEKFAREEYLMKKKDEDIFIIVEE